PRARRPDGFAPAEELTATEMIGAIRADLNSGIASAPMKTRMPSTPMTTEMPPSVMMKTAAREMRFSRAIRFVAAAIFDRMFWTATAHNNRPAGKRQTGGETAHTAADPPDNPTRARIRYLIFANSPCATAAD